MQGRAFGMVSYAILNFLGGHATFCSPYAFLGFRRVGKGALATCPPRKLRITLSFFLVLSAQSVIAQPLDNTKEVDQALNQFYQRLDQTRLSNMSDRLATISQTFIGKPYLLGALGEGSDAYYDQRPLYRTDAFDCGTYVDTVLALALASDVTEFKQCINKVRYKNGHVSYVDRNHFTCLDWNKNNKKNGFLEDITSRITNEKHQSVALVAHAMINKSAWYQHMSVKSIHLSSKQFSQIPKRLSQLQQEGRQFKTARSDTAYIPLTTLFDKAGKANQYLFRQIPNGAIIEIIRPNWDLSQAIGTHLNVSHLGFAFWKHHTLYFRNASSSKNGVVDLKLIPYLFETMKSPTIKGINIQRVVLKAPGACR